MVHSSSLASCCTMAPACVGRVYVSAAQALFLPPSYASRCDWIACIAAKADKAGARHWGEARGQGEKKASKASGHFFPATSFFPARTADDAGPWRDDPPLIGKNFMTMAYHGRRTWPDHALHGHSLTLSSCLPGQSHIRVVWIP